ncbi:hypothetical protein SAMN05216257_105239 [Meinhardsimonia xiamenensis]|jgi:hypothetical protein|uniref:Uncharacterized protein n=1 Tax=Meinhardsimonia xiamenensis TaxID=990712 RepID=A0A1G9FKQ2_9RHOB|nr:hypothetical protein [Meinhardsimonia xiamenensis]PRX37796.1 hypothetical protein LV81_00064 [Meinhardsimonia xiamenensis]SDK88949.1 hypothetical protein SAMN05216257_105239 [Meinhardsimonia xiamenensis]
MTADLPEFYFRTRENGAAVFRVSTANRQRRIELIPIAAVNIRNGQIRPHGEHELSEEEMAAIRTWMEERRAVLARRAIDDIFRTIDHLNHVTHWANAQASDEELEAVTDALLLAMHDLRSVLVRKKGDRLMKKGS